MKGLRWNPFAMWTDHCALVQRLARLEEVVQNLAGEVQRHQTMVGHELYKLKTPAPPVRCTLHDPLTPEQEEIVKEFLETNNLPHQIQRNFARGGIAARVAVGRFGEVPSEQTRSTYSVRALQEAIRGTESLRSFQELVLGKPYQMSDLCNTATDEGPLPNYSDLRRMAVTLNSSLNRSRPMVEIEPTGILYRQPEPRKPKE